MCNFLCSFFLFYSMEKVGLQGIFLEGILAISLEFLWNIILNCLSVLHVCEWPSQDTTWSLKYLQSCPHWYYNRKAVNSWTWFIFLFYKFQLVIVYWLINLFFISQYKVKNKTKFVLHIQISSKPKKKKKKQHWHVKPIWH